MGTLSDGVARWVGHVPPWAWALPALLFLALGVRTGIRLSRRVLARGPARARRLGRAGARRAVEILRREGFTVLGTEVIREGAVEIDGRLEPFVVRVDAVVRRRGTLWVAEVKAGADTATAHDRTTRRQMLEYAHVFGASGVLLVDARRGSVHVVRFPEAPRP